jgi:hypothetical protein
MSPLRFAAAAAPLHTVQLVHACFIGMLPPPRRR